MSVKNSLAVAISAGLAATAPTVVHAQCPAPVSGIISVTTAISDAVELSAVCELQAGQSISVGSSGSITATTTTDGGEAVRVPSTTSAGYIEIAGEVLANAPVTATSSVMTGVLVRNESALSGSVTVSGKVVAEGPSTVRGMLFVGGVDGGVEISGEVSADYTNPEASLSTSVPVVQGIELTSAGTQAPVTITETGSVAGYASGVAYISGGKSLSLGSFTNHGTVREPVGGFGVGGGITIQNSELNDLTNTGVIRAVSEPLFGEAPRRGIDVGNTSFVRDLRNEGSITAINGGSGVVLSHKYSRVSDLINSEGASISAINNGGNNEAANGVEISSGGDMARLRNEGTISGTQYGIGIGDFDASDLGSIGTLINLGVIEGDTRDIHLPSTTGGFSRIGQFVNAQSGLTYEGDLPREYVMVATSATDFGTLVASSPVGSMRFNPSHEEIDTNLEDNTLYAGVLTGVSADLLTEDSFSGNANGLDWTLLSDESTSGTWHLCVGDCEAGSAVPVPVLSPWGVGLMGGLMGLWGFLGLRRRRAI